MIKQSVQVYILCNHLTWFCSLFQSKAKIRGCSLVPCHVQGPESNLHKQTHKAGFALSHGILWGCDWVRKRQYLRRQSQILISKAMLLPHASVSWFSNPTNNTYGLSWFALFRITGMPVSGTLKLLVIAFPSWAPVY